MIGMQESTKQLIEEAGYYEGVQYIPEVEKLTKEMKETIVKTTMTIEEIKALVKYHYQIQDFRKAFNEQIRSIKQRVDPKIKMSNITLQVLELYLKNLRAFEKESEKCLLKVAESREEGRWLLGIRGVGPALSAGCLAYFDVKGRQYATQFISYAGLNDNNRPWLGTEKSRAIVNEAIYDYSGDGKLNDDVILAVSAKSQWKMDHLLKYGTDKKGNFTKEQLIKAIARVPYNRDVKKMMWKFGAEMAYNKKKPDSVYGKLLFDREAMEMRKNEEGKFAYRAKQHLEEGKKLNAEHKKLYEQGKLPLGEIHARCNRWVEKIFLSHLFEEMYRVENDTLPPRYFVFDHCEGHHDNIAPEVPYTLVTSEKEELYGDARRYIDSDNYVEARKILERIKDYKDASSLIIKMDNE